MIFSPIVGNKNYFCHPDKNHTILLFVSRYSPANESRNENRGGRSRLKNASNDSILGSNTMGGSWGRSNMVLFFSSVIFYYGQMEKMNWWCYLFDGMTPIYIMIIDLAPRLEIIKVLGKNNCDSFFFSFFFNNDRTEQTNIDKKKSTHTHMVFHM